MLALCGSAARAEPRTPTDDAEVLETMPRVLFHARDELTGLQDRLADNPEDAEAAAKLAGYYLQIGQRESDPRFYGFARAALAPWWDADDAPVAVLALRAKLKERDHNYAAARADLEKVLTQAPDDIQTLIEIANLYWVQGKYAEARTAVEQLAAATQANPETAAFGRIPLDAVTGRAQEAYDEAGVLLKSSEERGGRAANWVHAMQAEIARALGDDAAAESHFRDGLAADPGNLYLLRGFADLMLDHDRGGEVLPLLREHLADTGILLRAVLAARQAGATDDFETWRGRLGRTFDEIRRRGGTPHGRYEARFLLEVEDRPGGRPARWRWTTGRSSDNTATRATCWKRPWPRMIPPPRRKRLRFCANTAPKMQCCKI